MPKKNLSAREEAELRELLLRIEKDQHSVQAALGLEFSTDHPNFGDELNAALKHIRVGVDSAMASHGALVQTLFEAGVIGELEYYRNLALYMEREKKMHVDQMKRKYPNTTVDFV